MDKQTTERGLFFAIEGGDGSGKGTQSKKLEQYFNDLGNDVLKVSFPQHGQASAYIVDQYLNGAYGGVNDVHADLASLPYAIDRLSAKDEIMGYLNNPNGIVIADRYVASNLAHQGTKFENAELRKQYYERDMDIEYGILKIPKPDLNIVLLVPTNIAQLNVDNKETRGYTTLKRDIHEADPNHLERAKANYIELCHLYPKTFTSIDCIENEKMRPIDDIHNEILFIINSFLKNRASNLSRR